MTTYSHHRTEVADREEEEEEEEEVVEIQAEPVDDAELAARYQERARQTIWEQIEQEAAVATEVSATTRTTTLLETVIN